MGIIDNMSLNLSTKLGNKLNKNEEEKAVLNYGLFIILHTLSALILTIIFGIIIRMELEVLLIAITSSWFKRYTLNQKYQSH